MTHVTDEQMQAYILDALAETERTIIEEHVFSCDLCLEDYMKWIEINEHHLPSFTDSDSFTDEVMAKLLDQQQFEDVAMRLNTAGNSVATRQKYTDGQRSPLAKKLKPFLHYAIAASITLLLMSTGIFQGMTGLASSIDDRPRLESPSLSQNMMDRALQWLDFIQLIPKEDEQ